MALQVISQAIPEVKLIIPDVFGDSRGFFQETFHREKYSAAGIAVPFVQDNWSRSIKGTLRGLHYQLDNPQDKLVWVVRGEIYDVAVDIRRDSPTFGKWVGAVLSETNHHRFFIPVGFAHGFCVLSDGADFMYKCSNYYSPKDEKGILWSDPALAIPWPIESPILSKRDIGLLPLKDMRPEDLPVYPTS
ncbi:MAG: dTDP-4-dehydrorhamnose 3,5-epimerase [bacterium]